MKLLLLLIVVLTILQVIVNAAKEEDLVTKLPGLNGATPSKHYSGYLPVGQLSGTKGQLHYWYLLLLLLLFLSLLLLSLLLLSLLLLSLLLLLLLRFIESTKSPKDDPVVLWLNGGILID